jgi:hypothetical protein
VGSVGGWRMECLSICISECFAFEILVIAHFDSQNCLCFCICISPFVRSK